MSSLNKNSLRAAKQISLIVVQGDRKVPRGQVKVSKGNEKQCSKQDHEVGGLRLIFLRWLLDLAHSVTSLEDSLTIGPEAVLDIQWWFVFGTAQPFSNLNSGLDVHLHMAVGHTGQVNGTTSTGRSNSSTTPS